ncbi:ThiF family adenylyltransferase [Clostridium baratii]|uniref:ThiF family adenylyltransferase n=1 Tax=Clostridium baratii TaxID=1561 RepID=UPI0005F2ADB6|nr:ThiF family adenylyltransferase [Clostridium baratii]AQM58616.1 hypothetical protein NPD11_3043 [Clostridium baratii]KJU71559.1 hypothetical protein UC77_09095 [Clostridium baratii]
MNKFNIIVVGCGATGSNLIASLAQFAISEKKIEEIILIDGDIVEEKNYRNQKFTKKDLNKNKALVLASRYSKLGINISYVDSYIQSVENLLPLMNITDTNNKPLTIVIGCVDNNKARRVLNDLFNQVDDVIYIDTGNGTEKRIGQTIIGAKQKGVVVAKPVAEYFPEILDVEAEKQEEQRKLSMIRHMSCSQMLKEKPQCLAANVMSAATVFLMLVDIISYSKIPGKFFSFDAENINIIKTI